MQTPTNIIIADDHLLFGEGLKAMMKQRMPALRNIRMASNGIEVIKLVVEEPPEIIFMDIQMPYKDGISATKEIHENYPEIKIIGLTMSNEWRNIRGLFDAGAVGYILKTCGMDDIHEGIDAVLNNKLYYSKNVSDILIKNAPLKKELFKNKAMMEELSAREKEIVELICKTYKNHQIAEKLFLSEKTIEKHRENIYSKLQIDNVIDLVYYALDNNLINRKNWT